MGTRTCSGAGAVDGGIEGHVEFVFFLATDAEAEALIEAQGRVDFDDVELEGQICLRGFGDDAGHDPGADALPLEGAGNIELTEVEAVLARGALQPSDT